MLLKRHYKLPDGWQPDRNVRDAEGKLKDPSRPEGHLFNAPPLDYVEIRHTGTTREQNFSQALIERAVAEGWATLSKGKILLHVKPEDLTYGITRAPGRYCCHCAEKLEDDTTGTLARAHVKARHNGETSPDPTNVAGYTMLNYYECVLDAEQHAKFQAHPIGGKHG